MRRWKPGITKQFEDVEPWSLIFQQINGNIITRPLKKTKSPERGFCIVGRGLMGNGSEKRPRNQRENINAFYQQRQGRHLSLFV